MSPELVMKSAWLGGAGKIGLAIVRGVLSRGDVLDPGRLVLTARHPSSRNRLQGLPVTFTTDNRKAVAGAGLVVVCVHPDEAEEVLAEVSDLIGEDTLVLSVVTGFATRHFEDRLGRNVPVVRCVPNTAVLVGESMSVLCPGRFAREEHLRLAARILGCVGKVEVMDERHMDAVTGLAGCGPAFVFRIVEALAQGGVKCGLPREAARTLAAQVLKGAAELVLTTGRHPAELKDEVTTPGGCTIDGLAKLEERGLPIALIEAVETATQKAGRLYRKS